MRKMILLFVVGMLFLAGCMTWDDGQKNPNESAVPVAEPLFTGLLLDLFVNPWGIAGINAQQIVFTDIHNGGPKYLFGETPMNYNRLYNVQGMEEASLIRYGREHNPYLALGKFFRAAFFFEKTRELGDIPLKEAMRITEGVFTPRYDTQKEVILQCLEWLEAANRELSEILAYNKEMRIPGDILLDGDPAGWQRVVNSWSIRILLNVIGRSDEPDMDWSERLQRIVDHPDQYPFMETIEHDLVISWQENRLSQYPLFNAASYPEIQQRRFPLSATYVELLTAYRDPRLFVVALPTDSAKILGDPAYADKFSSYKGVKVGKLIEDINDEVQAGLVSFFNPSRYYSQKGENTIIIGCAEMMFCLAEAANRGLIRADGRAYFRRGVTASLHFYGISEQSPEFVDFMARIEYRGDGAEGLQQILEQKYIAFFQHSGWEPFFDQRRTGVPVFTTGPQNLNDGRIPKRWKYPQQEFFYNTKNVAEALQRQYGGLDDINASMWMIADAVLK